jgi:hypothetical protein
MDPDDPRSMIDTGSTRGTDLIDAIVEGRDMDEMDDVDIAGAPQAGTGISRGANLPAGANGLRESGDFHMPGSSSKAAGVSQDAGTRTQVLQGLGEQLAEAGVFEEEGQSQDAVVEALKKSIVDMPAEEKKRLGKDLKALEVRLVLYASDFASCCFRFCEFDSGGGVHTTATFSHICMHAHMHACMHARACDAAIHDLFRTPNKYPPTTAPTDPMRDVSVCCLCPYVQCWVAYNQTPCSSCRQPVR